MARNDLFVQIPKLVCAFLLYDKNLNAETSNQVDDLSTVEKIVAAPYRNYTHPDYGTVMRMLEREVPFQIQSHAS